MWTAMGELRSLLKISSVDVWQGFIRRGNAGGIDSICWPAPEKEPRSCSVFCVPGTPHHVVVYHPYGLHKCVDDG